MKKQRNIRIHGTYPHDSGRWQHVRNLTVEEAAELLMIELDEHELEAAAREREPVRRGEPVRWPNVYLWLNKGFVVLGAPDRTGLTELQAGMLEAALGPVDRSWPVGVQAVYLHDGRYSLIERV